MRASFCSSFFSRTYWPQRASTRSAVASRSTQKLMPNDDGRAARGSGTSRSVVPSSPLSEPPSDSSSGMSGVSSSSSSSAGFGALAAGGAGRGARTPTR